MGWSLLDHTGDLGLEIEAPDPATLFTEALRGFTDCLTPVESVAAADTRRVELTADGLDLLLVDWLQEALYLFETESLVFSAAEVELDGVAGDNGDVGDKVRLRSRLRGERLDPERHAVKAPVKAVTYHALKVTRAEGVWRARVVLDL